jgi:lipid-binding SYLF domain-containing protein
MRKGEIVVMKKLRRDVVAVGVMVVFNLSLSSAMGKDEPAKIVTETKAVRNDQTIVANASKAIKEITALQKRKIPPVLFKDASAMVIIPKASKQAFMIKGGSTGGLLLVRDKAGAWGNPVFVSLSGGTLGWQIVGDPMDIILLFRSGKQVDTILKGKLALDSKTNIVPGRVAATMTGASKEELGAEVTSYVRSHGTFVEEGVVAGTTLQINAAANDAYYGKPKIDTGEILSGKVMKSSEDVTALQKLMTDYGAAK